MLCIKYESSEYTKPPAQEFIKKCGTFDIYCNISNFTKSLFVPDETVKIAISMAKNDIKDILTTRAPLAYVFFWLDYDWETALNAPSAEPVFSIHMPIPQSNKFFDLTIDLRPVEEIATYIDWAKGIMTIFITVSGSILLFQIARKTFKFTQ